ncbi:hypothetical protein LR48_Vigan06g052900 [Vigna angularis]|uniref:Uncharacterized protein n=1 Tax=Phaseolus angularis TaxID=3914 RepID=A0A0L9UR35_PHAAN|nr:hypothetical protein LR48_Vigan06g052900 [Vigna angularis]
MSCVGTAGGPRHITVIWTERTNLGWQLMRMPVTTPPGCAIVVATREIHTVRTISCVEFYFVQGDERLEEALNEENLVDVEVKTEHALPHVPLGRSTTYVLSVQTVLTFGLTCRSVSTARPYINTSADTHDRPLHVRHLTVRHLGLTDVRQRPAFSLLNLKRSSIRSSVTDRLICRPLVIYSIRSSVTDRPIISRTFGFDPTDEQPSGLEDARQSTVTSAPTSNDVRSLGINVRPLDFFDVRPRAFVTSFIINVRSLALGLAYHSNARPSVCTSVQTVGRSASPFGFERSTIPVYERPCCRPFDLEDVRPFVQTLDNLFSTARPFFNTSAPAFGHTLLRPPDRHLSLINVRHLGFNRSANRSINVRQFPQEAFGHSISLTCGLKRPTFGLTDVRPPAQISTPYMHRQTPDSSVLKHSKPRKTLLDLGTILWPSLCSPKNIKFSNIPPFGVKSVRRLVSLLDHQCQRTFIVSAVRPQSVRHLVSLLDHQCQRTFIVSAVQPQKRSSVGFNRSTTHMCERSNNRPFGLAHWIRALDSQFVRAFNQSTVRPRPLDSNARQSMKTSVQTVDRSASPFGTLDNQCVRAFNQSTVRPRPLDSNARQIRVFKKSTARPRPLSMSTNVQTVVRPPFGFYRSAIHILTFGLTHSSFLPLVSTSS